MKVTIWLVAVATTSVALALGPAHGQDAASANFYRAAYLQSEKHDFETAAELFAQAAQSADATPEIKAAASRRLAECREEMAAADLASLMPAESVAYVQLANIGQQLTSMLNAVGLAGGALDAPGGSPRIPLEDGLSMPIDFHLSPALVRELGRVGGVAASLAGISDRGIPEGVVVVHLGDSDLLRGLAETGLQMLPPQQSIGPYATYRIPADEVDIWLVRTARLIILSNSRDQAAATVRRIQRPDGLESLGDASSFRAVADDRRDSLLFLWADAQRAAPLVEAMMQHELHGEELAIAQAVLNLRQIESGTLSAGATGEGLRAEATVRFTPGHQHLLYGLIRTAPIGTQSFALAPEGAAVVASIGLNPPAPASTSPSSATAPQVALMDIGREFFANAQSATLFVLPGSTPIPEIALVVQSNDSQKSDQLWNQLLSLPAMFGVLPTQSAAAAEIRGRAARKYQFPNAPPIVVVQPAIGALVLGTEGAVEASLAAIDGDKDVADDPRLGPMIGASSENMSKALYVNVGRAIECALPNVSFRERRDLTRAAAVTEKLVVGLTVDEGPSEFRVRLELTGVPQVSDVLRIIGRQHNGLALHAISTTADGPPLSAR